MVPGNDLNFMGLSPRGRGNQALPAGDVEMERSIPAWAGKPRREVPGHRTDRVYPRVGGETNTSAPSAIRRMGLSPRGRGNQTLPADRFPERGSIPAWAGKPAAAAAAQEQFRVYPRVGGETSDATSTWMPSIGLSPRGRGNQLVIDVEPGPERSIPAWAGKPRERSRPRALPGVYPRVGGETAGAASENREKAGLSPRGRGNRLRGRRVGQHHRSIPAWAGKPISGGGG